ncbi:ABC transporter substrate-binding protein [Nostoc sp. FACHB-152]|uniref:ABC transporter substrate-binding protein n=1 Tax=unclassified Nostoc TaxID=2593658 RepID=UPI00168281BE|nr:MULTISPECIES: ABC transporter substrate-binding protein [unclassified Nostoc]MBD2451318.1 ABC transporter substrate-binding protein [Nostoc sp. FACHB-152]MBD2471256.1 ABC transporter substrate-binding protein [Nostoc sp. FACHB-145]
MLYQKPITKLQKFIQKQSSIHIGIFLATLLSIILFSWVALSQRPVTLNMLITAPDAQPWRQGLIKDFEADNPGIRLNLVEGPNATNLLEDLYTSSFILGESPYDLINMDIIWTSKFAAAGWLLPLDNRISKEELAAFSPKDVEGGLYQDKLYRIPMRSDAGMLYYREDLIKQAGLKPPETFDDLIRISQTLKKKDAVNWGYVWQGRQYEGLVAMFAEVLDGFGGFWVNPDTLEVGLDRPETLKAIEFLRSTVSQGVSPPGVTTYQEEDTRRLFQSGQVAFLRSWPYAWPLAQAENSPIRGKVGIQPMVHAPGHTGAACLGGWGLGISKSSPHPEEAWKAIQYFTSEKAQRRFILNAGYVPSRRNLFTDPEIVAKYPHYPLLLEVVDNAVLRPPIAQYAQTSDILQRYLSAALSGRMNPEKAMQAAAAETRRLLGARG